MWSSPVFSSIIQLAISRNREYLADASAAYVTRYPDGLANALEKIKGDRVEFKSASAGSAHLFISNPFKQKKGGFKFANLFSTHPPIDERIRRLRMM